MEILVCYSDVIGIPVCGNNDQTLYIGLIFLFLWVSLLKNLTVQKQEFVGNVEFKGPFLAGRWTNCSVFVDQRNIYIT